MMEIRPTEIKDLPLVMEIYDYARAFMRATGNTTQWIDGYPSEALIRREIEESHSFACIDEQGEILGTFCFILGEDPTYEQIKQELQIMCVLFTEDVGGILRLEFDEKGNLNLTVESKEDDFFFDEIGSVLKIKQLRAEKRELLENMETYFRVFFLQEGQDVISD